LLWSILPNWHIFSKIFLSIDKLISTLFDLRGEKGAIDLSEKGVTFHPKLNDSSNVAYIGKEKHN
jgi:hypothetical protein